MEYLSLRKTAENGDFPLGEYKHCVVRIEYLVLQKKVHIGQFWLMRKNQRMKG